MKRKILMYIIINIILINFSLGQNKIKFKPGVGELKFNINSYHTIITQNKNLSKLITE
ncbi:hypothetical protein [Tenacibaculum sp. UWU-22]|uniref:hypothetical protein n=1 Tax=Tenacibaculum sp. UWU-22 TaxID=3234187 RepID=UPI0034DB56AB